MWARLGSQRFPATGNSLYAGVECLKKDLYSGLNLQICAEVLPLQTLFTDEPRQVRKNATVVYGLGAEGSRNGVNLQAKFSLLYRFDFRMPTNYFLSCFFLT